MVLSELSLSLFSSLKLPGGEVKRWKYSSCCSSGDGGRCTSNFRTNYHHYNNDSSRKSVATVKQGMPRNMSCSSSSSTSYYRGVTRVGRGLVESAPILKIMELLGSLRWIFLLILLTDSVIGHASDGGGGMNRNAGPSVSSFSSSSFSSPSSSSSSSSSSFSLSPPLLGTRSITSSSNINSNSNVLVAASAMALAASAAASSSGDRDLDAIITGPPATADLATAQVSSESPLLPTHQIHLQQQQQTPRKNYPCIDKVASPNVTALLGKTAYLSCRVKNLGDKTVSWVRHRDIHLLTVGRYTYTTDQRFRAIHQPNTEDYTLMIKYPQHRDSGIYECQVSTTPHLSHYVHLNVVEPVTEVVGGPDLFIDRGSTINLTCTVKYSPEPPSYIIWNHNNAIISYNSPRGGVSVLTEKGETTTSYLLIQQAKPTDSGRYSCNPSNAVPHSILVHVLNGELPAAMQTGGQMPQQIPLSFCLLSSVILIFVTS